MSGNELQERADKSPGGVMHRLTGLALGRCLVSLCRHREIVRMMIVRELASRYKSSLGGLAWSLLTPLLTLSVYTFVFSFAFPARWAGGQAGHLGFYALQIFTGLTVFGIFSESVSRAPNLVLTQPNFVKKVVFPVDILIWVSTGSVVFQTLVNAVVLLVGGVILTGSHWSMLLFPIVVVPLLVMCMGFSWGLASLGVYVRDTPHVLGLVTSALLFLSPVFYPVDVIPQRFRWLYELNPIAITIEASRAVLLKGEMPDWWALGGLLVVGLAVAQMGYLWFEKTQRGFADVI